MLRKVQAKPSLQMPEAFYLILYRYRHFYSRVANGVDSIPGSSELADLIREQFASKSTLHSAEFQ